MGTTTLAQGTGYITGGLSTVSLRGLGSTRTLVLINGLRSSVYGGTSVGSVVDIGAIPVATLQRVEVLKHGASAIGIGLTFDHSSPIMGRARSYATRYSPAYGNDVTSSFAFPANVALPANSPFDSLEPLQKKFSGYVNGSFELTPRSGTRCIDRGGSGSGRRLPVLPPSPAAHGSVSAGAATAARARR